MVVRNFDGPAGQMEDVNAAGPRRQTSQPEITGNEDLASAQRALPITSGLNLLTVGGATGGDYRSPLKSTTALKPGPPSRASSSSGRPPFKLYIPRYNLKTIPPKSPNTVIKQLRPSAQHVPGSYRSEMVSTPAGSIGASTPGHGVLSASEDQHFTEDTAYFGNDLKMPSSAVESLKNATAYGPSHDFFHVREIPSSEPPVDHFHNGRPAEPLLTLGVDHQHSHRASPAVSSRTRGSDDRVEKDEEQAHRNAPLRSVSSRVKENAVSSSEKSILPSNGPQLSELPPLLPPISQGTVNDLSGEQLNAKPSVKSVSSMDGSHSEKSKHFACSSAGSGPSEIRSSGNKHYEAKIGESTVHQHRSTDLLSAVSRKLASVGKSMSSLSEISLWSDPSVPSQSLKRQEKIDLINGGPKKYWMRQILGKASGSSTPGATPNLTSRPAQRQGHVVRATERQRAASVPTNRFPHASTNEASFALAQRKNDESFARVIVDLELLLKEALIIAHQAAGEDHSEKGRVLDQDSDNISRYTLEVSDGSSTTSGGNDEEDNRTTFPRRLPLRISSFPPKKSGDEEKDSKVGLSENLDPHVLETVPKTQVHSVQGGSEQSKDCVQDVLSPKRSPDYTKPCSSYDWAYRPFKEANEENGNFHPPRKPIASQTPNQERRVSLVRVHKEFESYGSKDTACHNFNDSQAPAIQPRSSSLGLRAQTTRKEEAHPQKLQDIRSSGEDTEPDPYVADFDYPGYRQHSAPQCWVENEPQNRSGPPGQRPDHHDTIMPLPDRNDQPEGSRQHDEPSTGDNVSLTNRHHFSIREPRGFSLSRSHRRAPIARDWSTPRKRWVATVACISTALTGLIIGIYAGEVPAIQYALVDEHHYTILGNVVFFIGLAITTALFWPLPLLHGRKPYTLAALAILLPLQFPQALVVSTQRSLYVATYRVGLLFPRAISGLIMGFANINFKATLLDLFGASLQSVNPHQEIVNINDVRRHGGGMGVWLSIWTWCYIGSLGVGFLIGAVIISGLNVAWGFWITIISIVIVLVLNVLVPEVRRSAYRRSMAEVRTATDVSRRVARGEVKMHLKSTGPIWWWEEVWAGHVLCIRMLKQPGFVVLALYLGWIYAQVVMVIVVCCPNHKGGFH